MRKTTIEVLLAAGVLAASIIAQDRAGEPKAPADAARPAEEFLMVPVRVHLLRGPAPVGVTLNLADIDRVFRKANGIWHAAGIHLWVESVIAEKPAGSSTELNALMKLRPAATRAPGMFHVYYVGSMPLNGAFIDTDALFVQQAAQLQPVPGGIDEPLPRVTAHELGHGMGLRHRQDRVNLMASGTTGTLLNEGEIQTARHTAEAFPWVQRAPAFLKRAEAAAADGLNQEAASRFGAILDLPGPSALKDRARADDPHGQPAHTIR